jgi:hypothetical protein
MTSHAAITDSDLTAAAVKLESLSRDEYGIPLAEVLTDPTRPQVDRLWRIGRLGGIVVKEPFAKPTARTDEIRSLTGARRAWHLDPEKTANPPTDAWQYLLLRELIDDRELREWEWLGPTPTWTATILADRPVPEDLDRRIAESLHLRVTDVQRVAARIRDLAGPNGLPAGQLAELLWDELGGALQSPWHVMTALQEMQNERGLWRCMLHSAGKYICGDAKLRAAIEESSRAGSVGVLPNPQALLGGGAVTAANMLADAVPWLGTSGALVAGAMLIVIGSVGLDGFCGWLRTEVEKPQDAGPREI